MIGLMKAVSDFVFPYRYMQSPEYQVGRNLLEWDRMVGSIN